MAPPPDSHLELNVLMGASQSPMIAVMVIPQSTSTVSINFCLNPGGSDTAGVTSDTLSKVILRQEDDQKGIAKVIPADTQMGRGVKRSHDTTGDPPDGKVSKHPKTKSVASHVQGSTKPPAVLQAGLSTIKVSAVPQYIPDSQEELLVLPPMPRSLFEELTTFPGDPDNSLTEPETSEDEAHAHAKARPFLT
ncbi:hypothetical protein EI94DRAFT_1809928 [Lactarius quietus]|nr:hypothetical protein EI94DRAFT_1809928 [Lactarius quietus]